jgi:hypothetical protein
MNDYVPQFHKYTTLKQFALQVKYVPLVHREPPPDVMAAGKALFAADSNYKAASRIGRRSWNSIDTIAVRVSAGGKNHIIGQIKGRWDIALRYADMAILHFAKYRQRGEATNLEDLTVSHPGVFNLGEKNARFDYANETHLLAHLKATEDFMAKEGLLVISEVKDQRVTAKKKWFEEAQEQIQDLTAKHSALSAELVSHNQTLCNIMEDHLVLSRKHETLSAVTSEAIAAITGRLGDQETALNRINQSVCSLLNDRSSRTSFDTVTDTRLGVIETQLLTIQEILKKLVVHSK